MSSGSSPTSAAARRHRILHFISQQPASTAAILQHLQPHVAQRTLTTDLAWLRHAFPGRVICTRNGRENLLQFTGDIPRLMPRPLTHLHDDQVAALIAARGLLRTPHPDATQDKGDGYHGALAQAIDRLLDDAGLNGAAAHAIAPDAVTISRFGVAPEEEAAFPLCLGAILADGSVTCTYTNLDGEQHPVHAKAVRLVHITGEWHLLAWSHNRGIGKLRQYRLSRMTGLQRRDDEPHGCPPSGLRREAAALLTDAFRATGSLKPQDRTTVILAVSPKAWPFLERRRWGASQHWDNTPTDLPPGWRRLRFTTTGLAEAQYWVLGFGTALRAEGPPKLIEWLHDQATGILAGFKETRQTKLPSNVVEGGKP